MLDGVIVRDIAEDDLDVLFDIQDDDTAQHMASFTSPDGNERRLRRQGRKIVVNNEVTKKVIVVDDEIVAVA